MQSLEFHFLLLENKRLQWCEYAGGGRGIFRSALGLLIAQLPLPPPPQVHQAALRCTHLSTACAAAAAAAQGGSAEEVAASREGLQGYIGAVQQEVQARLAARAELQALLRSQVGSSTEEWI